ncbi:MAG: hypothetical protein K5705_12880 [Oscillospiraceae bacterium]|nr:hypothetical protein [Oscillospiraceae bacterium]
MTIRNALASVLASAVLLASGTALPVSASAKTQLPTDTANAQVFDYHNNIPGTVDAYQMLGNSPQAAVMKANGLIRSYSVSISAGSRCIYLNASTFANATMNKVGIKNISVQFSENGWSNWQTVGYYSNQLASNTSVYSCYNLPYSVSRSGFYRVCLTHYAQKGLPIIGDSQSINNYSNAVKVN